MDIQRSAALASEGGAARANREQLKRAGVFTVNLIGGPGCGKTSLLARTLERLALKRRVAVVTADPYSQLDGERLAPLADQVVQAGFKAAAVLTARGLQAAVRGLNLAVLDLLLVENVSCLHGPGEIDLGEDVKVAMFSVAAGHDKPLQYPDVTRCAPLIILNKVDLLTVTPFDLPTFGAAVDRLNPAAEVLKLSTLTGEGLDAWIEWLLRCSPRAKAETSLHSGGAS